MVPATSLKVLRDSEASHALKVDRLCFFPSPCCRSGNVTTVRQDFPLPEPPASVEASGGFNYPNSNGFQYEAVAIHKCIREGRTCSEQYTPNDMLVVRLFRLSLAGLVCLWWASSVLLLLLLLLGENGTLALPLLSSTINIDLETSTNVLAQNCDAVTKTNPFNFV